MQIPFLAKTESRLYNEIPSAAHGEGSITELRPPANSLLAPGGASVSDGTSRSPSSWHRTANPADILLATSREIPARTTQLSHASSPDCQKLMHWEGQVGMIPEAGGPFSKGLCLIIRGMGTITCRGAARKT